MKAGKTKRMVWFKGEIINLMIIISVFICSYAWAAQPQVAAGGYHTVGLKSDGTVVAVGQGDYGQLDVSSWTDIIQIAAGYSHTVGLKANGTVVAVGNNGGPPTNVGSWTDIIQVAAGGFDTFGLKADGNVVAVGWNDSGQNDVSSWTDIIQVAAGYHHTVGLKANGTVVAVGGDWGQLGVGSWSGIIQVASSNLGLCTVGLKSDGSVVAVGDNGAGQLEVGSWTDIIQVAAGMNHTVGLKSDGSVVAEPSESHDSVRLWKKIIQVATGQVHTVGLKSDGTVVTEGDNDYGECNTSQWNLGRTPDIFPLVMAKAGAGSGSVTSDPSGIDCGIDCSERYQESTVVTLTASAEIGSVFRGWTSGGCSGTGVCVLTMNASNTVIATFTLSPELSHAEGTINTQVAITGSDFGVKKGKALIGGTSTKIITWTPSSITFEVKKPLPLGSHPVVLALKEPKGVAPIAIPGAFTMMAPEIVSVDPSGTPGEGKTLSGNYFGTKKGKVYLEYQSTGQKKNCKVTSWSMNQTSGVSEIKFVVPKPKGYVPGVSTTYNLKVTNKVGTAITTFRID